MCFLDRIEACNTYDLSGFVPFVINQEIVGWVRPFFAERLAEFPDVFSVKDDCVEFCTLLSTADQRSDAIATMAQRWVADQFVDKLRQEIYPVRSSWSAPDYFRLDRILVPLFGVRAYGVHLNGYVVRNGKILLWIGKRAADRIIEPGKLDNIVAGGQPANLSIMDNLIKECAEEANMPPTLARTSSAVGTISYCFENERGLKPDTLFCYDIEVPEDFEPVNQDGEIEDFRLMTLDEALALIAEGDSFKFNVALVILDFAIRHGALTPDTDADYEAIIGGLHAFPPGLST